MMENVMVKEKIEETNAEKTEKGEDAFTSIVDIIQSVFDTYKEIPRFSVWGKSGLYTAEEAAQMPTSMRALAKLANPKLQENAQAIAKKAEAVNKKFAGVSLATSLLGIAFDGKEIYDVWNNDEKSQTDKTLTTVASSFSIGENATYLVQNMQTLLTKLPKELGDGYKALGKVASVFKIASGAVSSIQEIVELSEGEQTDNERNKSICDLTAGILDVAGGILEFTPLALLAIPLSITSVFLRWAGSYFEEGNWVMGSIIAGIGLALGGTMLGLMIAFRTTIMTALGSLTASVSATVSTMLPLLPVVMPILVWVGSEIVSALTENPPALAQGGFPVAGQLFIAREAGPELVGTMRGRNAVVNKNQIVQSVSRGVSEAFLAACNGGFGDGIDVEVYMDGRLLATTVC